MRRNIIIIGIIVLILLVGFIMAQFIEPITPCTMKLCYPNEPNAEIPCNSCTQSQPVFVTGIINIIKSCPGTDILVFENSVYVGEKDRVEIDNKSCKYKIKFLAITDF